MRVGAARHDYPWRAYRMYGGEDELVLGENVDQVTRALQEMGYTAQQAEIALQNCDEPDVGAAIEWIQNNVEELNQMVLAETIA